ncbi:MAG: hypothetical protein GX431_06155 [Bacteroidales bacterium]|jgi:hypothetical protein|nr:hypothetical protein [Bacteroidales bacterium]
MIWKKVRRLIIPLVIAKSVIFLVFLFRTDIITISKDKTYINYNQIESVTDSIDLKRQKLIRIVRNEGDRGISVVLRGKKNKHVHRDNEENITAPVVD